MEHGKNTRCYLKIILLYVVFTVVVTAVGDAAFRLFPYGEYNINPVKQNWLNPFLRWDAIHYINIAAMGYGVYIPGNYAFFPLYPLLIRALTNATSIPYAYSALIVARLAFLAAILMLYRLGKEAFGQKTAYRAVVCLLLFPGSFFFLAAYTESLALLLGVCAFYYCSHKNWLMASLSVMFFGALKPIGILVGLIVLLEYLRQIDFHLRKIRPDILWLGLMPLGLFSYMAYLWAAKGNPLYFSYCEQFFQRYATLPGIPLLTSVRNLASFVRAGSFHTIEQLLTLKNYLIEILMTVSVGAGLVYMYRRMDKRYFIFGVLMSIVPFSSAVAGDGLDGMMRYSIVLFPLYFAGAMLFDRKSFKIIYSVVGAVLNIFFMGLFACWYWVA